MPDAHSLDRLLTETEAAAILNVKVTTLRRWRWAGLGPTHYKVGASAVRYHPADIAAFIEAGRRRSTADLGEAA